MCPISSIPQHPGNFTSEELQLINVPHFFNSSTSRIRSFQQEDTEIFEAKGSEDAQEGQDMVSDDVFGNRETTTAGVRSSILAKLAIVLGIAATVTLISVGLKRIIHGSTLGVQYLADGSSSSTLATPAAGFTFKAFGYKVVLPEYAPGYAPGYFPCLVEIDSFLKSLCYADDFPYSQFCNSWGKRLQLTLSSLILLKYIGPLIINNLGRPKLIN
ncbi:hypothetical protein F0562_021023 [Nyssa sinensis]|uniref:Uncharacterized protein n=1 Tax=Nyssa sinensis TaxID=561372 RepID=A0A5J5BP38_9ASTE|nr:hypothetical protein F0562_021023 [Nyssa sinensis]